MKSLPRPPWPPVPRPPAGGGPRWIPPVLGAALLGFFLISLDALIVTVALPDIGRSLGGGMSGLQWVVDGYTDVRRPDALRGRASPTASGPGARRRRPGALRAGLGRVRTAPGLGVLVVPARLVQGAAAAVMMPASLALADRAFPTRRSGRGRSPIWTVGGAVAAAAGRVGGALTASVGWRWIFFVNLPAGLLALGPARPGAGLRRGFPRGWTRSGR